MIQRIFHPIGQGAFYSERHEDINIVFDCGNWQDTKLSDKVVKQSFDVSEEIDILFISHFDFDHISKISTLKNHVKVIKRVVLPLLHENERIILSNIFRVLNFDFLTLINNPQQYFGGETRIVYINSTENNEEVISTDTEPQNIDIIPLNNENRIEIESGKAITLKSLKNWFFIPFNYEYKKRNADLITELENEGFDCKKLMSDSTYTLERIIKDAKLTVREGGKRFKNIYDRLEGKINRNSMLLYSGPMQKTNLHKRCFVGNCLGHYFLSYHYCYIHNKVGCIYTGDADLNIVNLKTVYKSCWDYVGTIQIPHHGDIKSFKNHILDDRDYCCPLSFGTNNTYGHPSNRVISDILSKRSCPVLVTDKLDSMFIEIIE